MPIVSDPLAALLALKRNSYADPQGGDMSTSVAEADPSNLMPGAITLPGSDSREVNQRLQDVLGIRSPELQQQQKDLLSQQEEHDAEAATGDPLIEQGRQTAQAEKIAQLRAPNEATQAGALAVEQARAQAQRDVATTRANSTDYAADAKAHAAANNIPAMTASKAIQAGEIANKLTSIDQEIDDPDLAPYIGPMMGRFTDLTSGRLSSQELAASMTPDPNVQMKLAKTSEDLLTSAAAVSAMHGRGGAVNPALLKEYQNSLTRSTTVPMLHGAIGSAKGWAITYAHPQALQPSNPNAPVQAALGMNPPTVRKFDPATGTVH